MKVLFITNHDINSSSGNGGAKCSIRNYELLKKINEIDLRVCILRRSDYVEDNISVLKINQPQSMLGELGAALRGYKRMRPKDANMIKEYVIEHEIELVWIDSSLMGKLAFLKKYCKVAVFFQNCEFDYSMRKVKKFKLWNLLAAAVSYINEKNSVKADMIVCLTERDEKRIQKLYGRRADFIMPITFEDTFDERHKYEKIENNSLLFIGSCFDPNYDSIVWFANEVMSQIPEINLTIVGKGFEKKKNILEELSPNIEVIGSVDRLEDYYYRFPVIVMPSLYGDGMKVQTAEALMYGKTIIASDEALEGYDVNNIEGIFRCNTPEEYISCIKMIFSPSVGGWKFQPAVRELFLKKYSTDSLVEEFGSLILN